jgi:hypothetical protein
MAVGGRLGRLTAAAQSAPAAWDARLGRVIHVCLRRLVETTSSWFPTRMVKECSPWRSTSVGLLQGWDDSATAYPDQGGTQEVHWELIWQLLTLIVFAR